MRYICFVQVLYSKKDSEGPPSVQVAEGEGSVSLLLGALQKYTVYVLQVLAYTRMGDGPPSNRILLRTKEDGRTQFSLTLSNHQLFNICFHIFYLVSTNSRAMCPSGIYHLQTITSNHTHITDTQHKQVQIRPRSIMHQEQKGSVSECHCNFKGSPHDQEHCFLSPLKLTSCIVTSSVCHIHR